MTVDADTLLSDAANSYSKSFLVVLELQLTIGTKVRSSVGINLRPSPEHCYFSVVPRSLYLQTIVCTDVRGTSNCLQMVPNEKLDL